jgi:hypothetical protein
LLCARISTRSDVAEALDYIRRLGIKLDIYAPSDVADLRNYGRDNLSLGIVPLGTANDFAKGAGIDMSLGVVAVTAAPKPPLAALMKYELAGPTENLLKTRVAVDQARLSRLATQNAIGRSRTALAETIALLVDLRYTSRKSRNAGDNAKKTSLN